MSLGTQEDKAHGGIGKESVSSAQNRRSRWAGSFVRILPFLEEAGAPAEKASSVEEAAEVSSSADVADRVDKSGAPAIPENSESGQNDPDASKVS